MANRLSYITIPADFIPVTQDGAGVPNATTTVHTTRSPCRGLSVTTAGYVKVKMQNTNVRTIWVVAGLNPGLFLEVQDSTAVATPKATFVQAIY